MCDAHISLLAVAQITLRDQNMTHRQHTQTSQLFWTVEDNRRETARHLTVQTNLDSGLNLVLVLYQQIEKLLRVQNCFTIICHQSNQCCVPLVRNLRECSCSTTHQNLSDSVIESLNSFLLDSKVCLGCHFLGRIVLEIPYTVTISRSSRLCETSTDWVTSNSSDRIDSYFKSTHIKEQVRIVSAVNTDKGVVPVKSGDTSWETVLHVPESRSAKVHIPLQQAHTAIARPALLVSITNSILVVWIRVLNQVSLDQVLAVIGIKLEQHVHLVKVPSIHADRVAYFCLDICESEILVWSLWRSSNLTGSSQSEDKQIKNQTIVLSDKGCKL
mmetsp:Transcript_31628/g.76451  ORF Transcript_31628/g.76451 Transcript_31628/m.76451 type:complete len:329 (-) Transcript_31628:2992-3978(-)